MPVTFYPAKHGARAYGSYGHRPSSASEFLKWGKYVDDDVCKELLQSSFSDINADSSTYTSSNGFVHAAVNAYSSHQHLIIRPDDVWITILTQFCIYVNEHAEAMRKSFVAHEGKKTVVVTAVGNRYTVNFGQLAKNMSSELEKHVVDASLREWIIADFTTTTDNDRVVSSVLMMATLQKYFEYTFRLACGIPSVTLLGERSDWVKILGRLDKLLEFGDEPTQWHRLLKPVLERFVTAFDSPDSKENMAFWQTIAHHSGGGSGPTYLSGWITAFCFWDGSGKSLYAPNGKEPTDLIMRDVFGNTTPRFCLDGVKYHRVDSKDIPKGYATVPVTIDDNGYEVQSIMVAGSVGIKVLSSGKELEAGGVGLDTFQPVSGWWIFETRSDEELQVERNKKSFSGKGTRRNWRGPTK